MGLETQRKWDLASRTYDILTLADERRFGPYKRRLFSKARGATLLVAAGTGNDFKHFPPGRRIVAIDVSPQMLARAVRKTAGYAGKVELLNMDVRELAFPEGAFDTIVTVCTFCSVPNPLQGLRELNRVLKPSGQLLMFEHVRSKIGPLGAFLDLMTLLTRRIGPDMNRDTATNATRAGFRIVREDNVYLDIVKTIEAVKNSA
jgi:ubiquinone/menaquinone biosynthesis C-methylase UbiE